jgi:hypothetical protein
MREVCSLIWLAWVGAFRSRVSLEAENTTLRHQLNVLRRQSPKRPTFGMLDRLIFAGLYRLAPLGALAIVKPETVIKWHRAGFRSYWRWKSRRRGGRPTVAPEIRKPIREMSMRQLAGRSLIASLEQNENRCRVRPASYPRRI